MPQTASTLPATKMFPVILTLCILCSCAQAQDSRTIFQFLQDEHYNTLVDLILGAGLSDEFMNTDSNPITLFAPTDAAFQALPPDVLVKIQTNTTLLKQILDGHVVDETIFDIFIRNDLRKTSVAGTQLVFNKYANGVKTLNGATVGSSTLLANGVVLSLSRVLLPLDDSISAIIAESDPEFRDLFGFLVLSRLFGTLSTGGPYTVFAPTDGAFDQVDVTDLINNRTALVDVLLKHVVSGAYWSAGLTDGMTLDTLQGSQITISAGAGGVSAGQAKVTTADIGASNGVIHVIDTVLLP